MAQINKPTDYFNTKLYTGDGTTSNSITGVGFKPDLVWIKIRNAVNNHVLYDVVRGADNTLRCSTTDFETNNTDAMSSFNADGFTVGENGFTATNDSGFNYASWNWLAGGTASSNTDGDITSSVSANTTSGFSIVTFTGNGTTTTVGHGLGITPKFYIIKSRSTGNWWTYTTGIDGSLDFLYLQATDAKSNSTLTDPTSSVFSVNGSVAPNTENMVAYCFAEKKGFSKFGSYTGNGNDDGTFVYTGFKPAFVLIKCSSTSSTFTSWSMFDTSRSSYNVSAGNTLYANSSINEGYRGNGSTTSTTSPAIDLLSNGFKLRKNADETNASQTYIYMAFAESPLVGTNNIPATAR